MNKIRYGVIGIGNMGSAHSYAIDLRSYATSLLVKAHTAETIELLIVISGIGLAQCCSIIEPFAIR